ncbi:hypothetical protein KAI10_07335 [Candidatus Bathyarchaeota archaeon]|nr:hypothetical protein [Candidatus Bathyarchaeota archaeon]
MSLSGIDGKERMALIAGLVLVAIVFASSAYTYLNPPIRVWEGKVFDVWETDGGNTNILSYGEGKIKLPGSHEIELDATYRITYQSRQRFVASVLISIEKIDG